MVVLSLFMARNIDSITTVVLDNNWYYAVFSMDLYRLAYTHRIGETLPCIDGAADAMRAFLLPVHVGGWAKKTYV